MKTVPSTNMAVLGAGSWGTALSFVLAENGVSVNLWGHRADEMAAMQTTRENQRFLPGFTLPKNIHPCLSLADALEGVRDVLIVVPSHVFRDVLCQAKPFFSEGTRLAWATKGLEEKTNLWLDSVVKEELGADVSMALLTGPSFAKEVVRHRPTAVILTGNDEAFSHDLRRCFHHSYFRVYENSDLLGAQLCGALKNVMAIATGIADGMQLGANAQAALIARGLSEMSRLCVALGGRIETVMGLAGVGDLVLTCTGDLSRNRRLGLAIGRGETIDVARAEIGQAVEGMTNTRQFHELAQQHGVEMPIVEQVYHVLFDGRTGQEALSQLLEREATAE